MTDQHPALADTTSHDIPATPSVPFMLEFESAEVVEAIFQAGVVETPAEAATLFDELKKFLVLAALQPIVPMPSALVDAAWHQFILHTEQYTEYCRRGCGTYLHHEPGIAESSTQAQHHADADAASIEGFIAAYERRFGPLPALWRNEHGLRSHSLIRRRDVRECYRVETDDCCGYLVRGAEEPQVVCRTSLRACAALEFIAAQRVFFVRELPGLGNDRERLAVVSPLLRYGVLRLDV